jgi:phosphoglycolate phosphatase
MRLAVFDLDGTLVDSRASIGRAMASAFAALGLKPPDYDETRKIVGLSLVPAIEALAPALPKDRYPALAEAYRDAFLAQRAAGLTEQLYPGARATVLALKEAGWLLGIATGKARRGVDHFLDAHGLRGVFDCAYCAEDGPGKPDPHMLSLNLRHVDVAPHAAIMIGDTSFDMAMARAIGAYAQGVAWGFHTVAEIEAGGAHAVAAAFSDLDLALGAFAARESGQT